MGSYGVGPRGELVRETVPYTDELRPTAELRPSDELRSTNELRPNDELRSTDELRPIAELRSREAAAVSL
jgi:hypothetical protein